MKLSEILQRKFRIESFLKDNSLLRCVDIQSDETIVFNVTNIRNSLGAEVIKITNPKINESNTLDEFISIIEASIKDNAAILIIGPDIIRASGYMDSLRHIAESGKTAILSSELRVTKNTFLPEYINYFLKYDTTRGILPREMVNLALKHLHPVSRSFFWSSKKFVKLK